MLLNDSTGPGGRKPWDGIDIVVDVDDPVDHPGVDTLEGRIGNLLRGEFAGVDYLEMPPDLYLFEHAHDVEILVYTVRGRWVLCSEGRRRIIDSGSLCRFKAGTSKGYEVPFPESSLILIVRSSKDVKDGETFLDYYRGLARQLEEMRADGKAFRISQLPPDHPARLFAGGLERILLFEQYGVN